MSKVFKMMYIAITGMLLAITTQASGTDFCSQDPCEQDCFAFQFEPVSIYGDVLYWRPQLCGLEAAFGFTGIETTVDDGFTTVNISECDREPTPEWNVGGRVGADAVWNCFDLGVEWTHFNGSAKYHADVQHGHWKIRYDVIDLTLGGLFRVGSRILLKPYFGVTWRAHRSIVTITSRIIPYQPLGS